jgi:hypothetical protein
VVAEDFSKTLGFLRHSSPFLERIGYSLQHGCDKMRPGAGLEFATCSGGSSAFLALIDGSLLAGYLFLPNGVGLVRRAALSGLRALCRQARYRGHSRAGARLSGCVAGAPEERAPEDDRGGGASRVDVPTPREDPDLLERQRRGDSGALFEAARRAIKDVPGNDQSTESATKLLVRKFDQFRWGDPVRGWGRGRWG